MKVCKQCNINKDKSSYYVNSNNSMVICKECHKENARQRKYKDKDGHIYIIVNPAWGEWCKIGMSKDATTRINTMNTNSPFRDYSVYCYFEVEKMNLVEVEAHSYLKECGIEYRSEWFKVDPEECIVLVENACRNLVSEGIIDSYRRVLQ